MEKIIGEISYQQLDEIIELIKNIHAFDFSNYTKASLKRRFQNFLITHSLTLVDLKIKITNQPKFLNVLLEDITVNVTEMFRDADFYKSLSLNVIPYLSTYQRIKVWNAGVSSGEELYSFSILFDDANLYNKCFFYGTDINTKVLNTAKEGIYDLKKIKIFEENFTKLGLVRPFSNYFTVQYQNGIINAKLRQNCLFSVHNLISDGVFNEFQLVSCRNVFNLFRYRITN